jgi:hypothetical protein
MPLGYHWEPLVENDLLGVSNYKEALDLYQQLWMDDELHNIKKEDDATITVNIPG